MPSRFRLIALLVSLLVQASPVQDITSSSSEQSSKAASVANKNIFDFGGAAGGGLVADSFASSTIYGNINTNEITKSLEKSQETPYSSGSGYTRASTASYKSAKAYIRASKTNDFFINASHHNVAPSAVFY